MLRLLLSLFLIITGIAEAQNSPCYWSGQYVRCFPTNGIFLDQQRGLFLGDSGSTNYVELKAPASVTTYALTYPSAQSAAGQVLSNDGTGIYSWVSPVLTSRTISTTVPLTGGGALSSNLTLGITQSGIATDGYLSSTDWNTFNNKQAGALTSDVTTPSNTSTVTTVAKIQGTTVSGTTGSGAVVFGTGPTMSNPIVGTQAQADASTKAASTAYVTTAIANAIAGVNPAVAVQAATTSSSDTTGFTYNNGVAGIGATLTSNSNNTPLTVDGFTFTALNQRLLVKDNSTSANNGIFYVTQVQALALPIILTRALDFDTPSDINNTGAIPVINGTVNGTTQWVVSSSVSTVGTDPITFTEFTRNPADYLLKANNLSDVNSKSTSFNNLSPMTTVGDIIYENATPSGTRLPIGSSGQVLTISGGIPTWQTPGGSSTNGLLTTDQLASTLATIASGTTLTYPVIDLNSTTLTNNGTLVASKIYDSGSGGKIVGTGAIIGF